MSYAKEIAHAKDKMEILKKQSHYEPLALDDLVFHPENHYPIDADALSQLADDIERNGLLHNLVVSCRADGVTVVLSGERRLRALQMLRNRNPESGVWDFAQCLIYQDLTPRQELILMDAANLQARGGGKDESAFRKAMNRYIDNIKEEFGLSEKAAVHMTTELGGASGPTVKANRRLQKNLPADMVEKVDSGEINKGDAVVIAGMDEKDREDFLQELERSENPQEVIASAVEKEKERKQQEDKKDKKKTEKKPDKPKPEDPAVTVTQMDPRKHLRRQHLDKLDGLKNIVVSLNTPDIVAQMKRLDLAAEEDGEDTILLHINTLIAELIGLKQNLKAANGEIELNIDPIYGHHRGNKGEEGYVGD